VVVRNVSLNIIQQYRVLNRKYSVLTLNFRLMAVNTETVIIIIHLRSCFFFKRACTVLLQPSSLSVILIAGKMYHYPYFK